MDIQVTGSNHRTSPLDFRERIALTEDENMALVRKLKDMGSILEAAALSTCNRFEVYTLSEDPGDTADTVKNQLFRLKSIEDHQPDEYFYTLLNRDAVRHLFRVSSGVDSMVRGEPQILGQVKDAYRLSTRASANGVLFNRLFHMAFRVGKRARTETEIGIGAVSVSYAAVELARKVYVKLSGKRALLIGASEMGELAVNHLKAKGVNRITIANRTFLRGQMMAQRLGLAAVPLSGIYSELIDADLVVVSTRSEDYLITYEQMKDVMKGRRMRHLLVLDISLPRNVDPRVKDIENVFLYDIDSLKNAVDKNINKREEAAAKIESFIESEAERFMNWVDYLELNPVIEEIRRSLESIREDEIQGLTRKKGDLDEQQVRRITKGLTGKFLHLLVTNIKSLDIDADKRLLAYDLITRLFKTEKIDL